eukprot:7796908-Pyramimonas_sp.AAC.1
MHKKYASVSAAILVLQLVSFALPWHDAMENDLARALLTHGTSGDSLRGCRVHLTKTAIEHVLSVFCGRQPAIRLISRLSNSSGTYTILDVWSALQMSALGGIPNRRNTLLEIDRAVTRHLREKPRALAQPCTPSASYRSATSSESLVPAHGPSIGDGILVGDCESPGAPMTPGTPCSGMSSSSSSSSLASQRRREMVLSSLRNMDSQQMADTICKLHASLVCARTNRDKWRTDCRSLQHVNEKLNKKVSILESKLAPSTYYKSDKEFEGRKFHRISDSGMYRLGIKRSLGYQSCVSTASILGVQTTRYTVAKAEEITRAAFYSQTQVWYYQKHAMLRPMGTQIGKEKEEEEEE